MNKNRKYKQRRLMRRKSNRVVRLYQRGQALVGHRLIDKSFERYVHNYDNEMLQTLTTSLRQMMQGFMLKSEKPAKVSSEVQRLMAACVEENLR